MRNMKKTSYLAAALLLAGVSASCEQEGIYDPVDFRPTLDAANTYRVGEPVVFNFEGNADYITIWDGAAGHEYRFKDRTSIAAENIEACKLELSIFQNYGETSIPEGHSMDIYATNKFKGLNGNDAEADGALIKQITDSQYEGWRKLEYADARNGKYVDYTYNIVDFAENFSFGLHYVNPAADKKMRAYNVNVVVEVQFKGFETQRHTFEDLGFTAFRTAGLYLDKPYITGADINQSGMIKFINGKNPIKGADIAIQGFAPGDPVDKKKPDGDKFLPIDQWVMMRPMSLNSIAPDMGLNIKGYADDVPSYSCIYKNPGTYTVTFVAGTGNYEGQSSVVHEMTVTIVDPVTAPTQK
ncbi:MAG: DUF5017 domain-containing protein [Alistipes sp.]